MSSGIAVQPFNPQYQSTRCYTERLENARRTPVCSNSHVIHPFFIRVYFITSLVIVEKRSCPGDPLNSAAKAVFQAFSRDTQVKPLTSVKMPCDSDRNTAISWGLFKVSFERGGVSAGFCVRHSVQVSGRGGGSCAFHVWYYVDAHPAYLSRCAYTETRWHLRRRAGTRLIFCEKSEIPEVKFVFRMSESINQLHVRGLLGRIFR